MLTLMLTLDWTLDTQKRKKERKKEKKSLHNLAQYGNFCACCLTVNTPLIQSFRKCTADARHQAGVLSPSERSPKWG